MDIGETAKKHAAIVPQLLAVHAITGCDTVTRLPGIGKITAIKTLLAGQPLRLLGGGSSQKDITAECTQFIAACYGSKKRDMSLARIDVWSRKMAKPMHLNSSHFHQLLKHLNKMFEGCISRQPSRNQLMNQIYVNLTPQRLDT